MEESKNLNLAEAQAGPTGHNAAEVNRNRGEEGDRQAYRAVSVAAGVRVAASVVAQPSSSASSSSSECSTNWATLMLQRQRKRPLRPSEMPEFRAARPAKSPCGSVIGQGRAAAGGGCWCWCA